MGFWFVYLIVRPSPRLLYSNASPLWLREQLALMRHLLVDFLGEHDMTIFVVIIIVLFGILDLVGIVRHIDYTILNQMPFELRHYPSIK